MRSKSSLLLPFRLARPCGYELPSSLTKGPRQLFGLFFSQKGGRDDLSTSSRSSSGGPGPGSVCRAHLVDSTTANKIQGPGLLSVAPAQYCARDLSRLVG